MFHLLNVTAQIVFRYNSVILYLFGVSDNTKVAMELGQKGDNKVV